MLLTERIRRQPLSWLSWGLAAASALILSFALISQYGFGLHPCELCLYQRYPYAAIMVIGGIAPFLFKGRPRALLASVWLGILLLLADAGIALYHAGVELKIFPGPDACSSAQSGEMTLEEMRAAIMNAPLVSCDQAMASFMGLSMAAWNALAAIGLALTAAALALRLRKRS